MITSMREDSTIKYKVLGTMQPNCVEWILGFSSHKMVCVWTSLRGREIVKIIK
jgi:hypothetical protein